MIEQCTRWTETSETQCNATADKYSRFDLASIRFDDGEVHRAPSPCTYHPRRHIYIYSGDKWFPCTLHVGCVLFGKEEEMRGPGFGRNP